MEACPWPGLVRLCWATDPVIAGGASSNLVILRESGGSSTPRPIASIADFSGILDHPPSRVMTVVGVLANMAPRSRGAFRPSFARDFLALQSEGAGRPGARCAR